MLVLLGLLQWEFPPSVVEAFLRDHLNKLTFAVKFRTFSHVAVPSTQHSMGLVGLADA